MSKTVDFTQRCDDPMKLVTMVRVMVELAMAEIAALQIKADLFETLRSQARQNWIYCQGRTVEECIAAGISVAFAKRYADPKDGEHTWTLNSKHKTGRAVDIVPYINGKLTWSHDEKEQNIIEEVMKKYGFECGTNWEKNRDSCHYEVDGNFTTVFKEGNNNKYLAAAVQTALNKKISAGFIKDVSLLKVDGDWKTKTTAAVNAFRKAMKYKTANGQLGAEAFKALFN